MRVLFCAWKSPSSVQILAKGHPFGNYVSSKLTLKYQYQEILRPTLDDLRELETEDIYIKFDNCFQKSYEILTMVVADNLAAHDLGDF